MYSNNNNKGAISALKGYRKQFLYTLQRILCFSGKETEFRPEGKYEDLDIYDDNGKITEVIQVKALSQKLTLSDILETKKTNTFLQRSVKAFSGDHSPIIKLVSYGEVNDDIRQLSQRKYSENFKSKLRALKLKETDISLLQNHFECEVIVEENIIENVKSAIEKWGLFSDISITLDLLIYWIYFASENQLVIKIDDFKHQVGKIDKYLIDKISLYELYGTLIRPLNYNIENEDLQVLKSDFYKGISVSFKHIIANVDVLREEKLKSINEKFHNSKVVFIHGASGQGKSSLAYRYLFEYCSENTVYEITLSNDPITIYKTINTLENISKGIRFSITLYIDIVPGNSEWIKVISELASKNNFNFLITIRSEDWNYIQIQAGDKLQFDDIELTLEKDEAEQIYISLDKHILDYKFIDFEEAWSNFGGKGPLLEFIYLITQNERLSAKLRSQINNLRIDQTAFGLQKVKLLRYIVLADSYSSKIKYKEIAHYLKINDLDLLIDMLKKEYLIKITEDKSYITGLHPVRSEIIKDLLFDNEIYIISDYVLESINFISENTILNFLRFAFRRANLSPEKLLDKLSSFLPTSWLFYDMTFKSLLWKGIEDYVNKNINLLNRIYKDYNKGWITVLDFDFSGTIEGGSFMQNSDLFYSEEQRQYSKTANSELSSKEDIYVYCIRWFKCLNRIEIGIKNTDDWSAFSNILFWLHHLGQTDIKINFNNFDFDISLSEQPLTIISDVLYSLKNYNDSTKIYTKKIELTFLKRLTSEYNVIVNENTPDSFICHYLIDIVDNKLLPEENDFAHAISMRIIELIRYAFPEKEIFGSNGVGHKFSFLPEMHDSSIKRIPKKSLPLKQLVEINRTYINIFEYTKRITSWQEYANLIIGKRELYVEFLNKLVIAFILYHKQKNYQPLAQYVQEYFEDYHIRINEKPMPSLPKSIIDEWGLSSEGQSHGSDEISNNKRTNLEMGQILALKKYKNYLKLLSDYESSLDNFLNQSAETITRKIKLHVKQDVSDIQDNSRISLVANLYKAFEIIIDFQNSFKLHFAKFIDFKLLQNIEKKEFENISVLCFIYRHFILSNLHLTGDISTQALNRFKDTDEEFRVKMKHLFKNLKKKLDCDISVEFIEEDKCCVIIADTNNPIKSIEITKNIYDVIYTALGQPDHTSLKYLIVQSKFPDFYVIPLVLGKTINSKWYDFKTYNLRDKPYANLVQVNLIPQDIPYKYLEQYKLQRWDRILNEFNELDQLLQSVATCYQLVFHFSQLEYFEDKDTEDYNSDIFSKHIQKTGKLIQENFQKALDIFGNYDRLYRTENINFTDYNEKLEFSNLLNENHKYFYPTNESFEKGEMKFNLGTEEMKNWIPRLEKLTNSTSVIYYFIAGKIIEGKITH